MHLHKSEKAKLELSSKARVLGVRERGALLMADGQKTLDDIQRLLRDDGSLLQRLMDDGYLIADRPAVALHSAAFQPTHQMPLATVQATPPQPPPQATPSPQSSGDSFEGKRSLATTRMFLFDICERMFVRKMPAVANQFRNELREARDRESMMAIARQIILRVEEIAGAERADGLSERIAMLLPPE